MSLPSVTATIPCKYDGGPRPGTPTFGVLHDAETPLQAGYARSIAGYFQRNTNQTSAHYMVDPVDTVAMLGDDRIAWHCGNGNPRSIAVEQAGYAAFTAAQWTTADGLTQMARVAALMRDLRAAHGIGLYWMTDAQLLAAHQGKAVGGWATHAQCSRVLGGSTHTDPTPNYPLAQLMALANQETDMPLTQAEKDELVNRTVDGVINRVIQGSGPGSQQLWQVLNHIDATSVQARDAATGANQRAGDALTAINTGVIPKIGTPAPVSVDASAFLGALKADPDAMALLGAAFAKAVNDDLAKRVGNG